MVASGNQRRKSRGSCRKLGLVCVATFLTSALTLAAPATAQQFEVIKPKITARQAKAMRGQAAQAMRDSASFQTNKQVLDDYFNKFYFPQMTLPAQLGQLGKARESLFKQFIRPARVPAAQQHLTNLTLKAMRVIAQGNYHPAVRYNAVLILGMLDEKVAGAAGVPPVPLPAAANELLELLEKDQFNDVKVPASIKLGALVGLERHARFGIHAKYADRLTKASLAVIAQKEPPADLDADVHHWIKCQAASVLARQYAQGPNAQVQAALTSLIADTHMGLEDRCSVASLLKKIKYDTTAGIDVTAMFIAMGDLMKSVASDEAEKANAFQQATLRSSGSVRFGVSGTELTYQRRRLIARLQSIIDGAKSLGRALPDAEREQLKGLLLTLTPVLVVAHDKDSGDLDITPQVVELEGQVRALVDRWKKAEEEPAAPKVS